MSRYHSSLLFLMAIIVLYYIIPINGRLLWQPDETRYAEISREMLATGRWAAPYFLDIRYFEKPVLGYWVNNLGQWLFGESSFAVRFGSIASTLLTSLLLARFAWSLWRCRLAAYLTAVIHLTLFIVYGIGTYAVLDPIVSLWLVAAMMSCWYAYQAPDYSKKIFYYALLGICCGLGVMTKGFIALAVPVISVVPWLLITQRRAEVILYSFISIISCLLTLLPWGITIAQQEPDFWHYFFWVEHIQRFAHSNAQHNAPFWYYFPCLIAGSLPWLGLLPGALLHGWQHRRHEAGYLLAWTLMPLLFFSLANGKLLTYILPCFAPLALLMARYLQESIESGRAIIRATAWINILFASLVIIAIMVASPWGLLKKPFWTDSESIKCLITLFAFTTWLLCACLSLKTLRIGWTLIACCPLGLALTFWMVIPTSVLLTKTPQFFLQHNADALQSSQFILSNDVGIAAGIAWQLKRSDVIMLKNRGELAYGLSYPDAQQKFVSLAEFPAWLAAHRAAGTVSLFLKVENNLPLQSLPAADHVIQQGRIILMQYLPQ
ncbi:lipid IV(A) 4-amino-4-deoxy-L-arabinosyltransferase [Rosenbergiella sp. S61]|uniref:Undecaprenyl phosphate-alpha-4-amino-4-deoxy-L-arabinose arabinosyl transferase n=1 Tax=Rosenbergiella gaditana TaxID=2726987 RepID=A0ABS5T027_9GAMM|nr:lipid IV(A) 4-amino-4-deoxy-L-arabinosyltransferase [Rosenbergiella gaditana]MBT0725517.1 lipid IV(A) 4-amino-4-deoxy-L-arabinosyltransferase [Rosenbergiella gaditana]